MGRVPRERRLLRHHGTKGCRLGNARENVGRRPGLGPTGSERPQSTNPCAVGSGVRRTARCRGQRLCSLLRRRHGLGRPSANLKACRASGANSLAVKVQQRPTKGLSRVMVTVEEARADYRPRRITTLFVAESAPVGGTFFYHGTGHLGRYLRRSIEEILAGHGDFLKRFE